MRHYKPDPEIYRLVPDLFDLEPKQIMLVAAHEHDLQAAQKHGLRTAYVHCPLEHGPNKSHEFPAPGRHDFLAKNLIALADQVGV